MADWNNNLTNLRDILADIYWDKNNARNVARQAGMNPGLINITDNAYVTWFNILDRAQVTNKVQNVIDVAQRENPDVDALKLAGQNALTAVRGTDIAQKVEWKGDAPVEGLEKLMGKQNTLLPIAFLETGQLKARAVVRVQLADGASGSGFVTEGNLLVTNHHVITSVKMATSSTIQFNYQLTVGNQAAGMVEYKLSPQDGFATSEEEDWTAVRIQGDAARDWGFVKIAPPDPAPKADDFAIIIQHPMGGPKQIGLFHNLITYAGDDLIQYLTDTLPGSSGSPVFDMNWQLIGLHHSGGWLREPGSKQTVYRNEGISIAVVSAGLKKNGLL